MNADWRHRYEIGIKAAQEAGDLALEYFDRPLDVIWKEDASPVTIADRNAEKRLRETLLGTSPPTASSAKNSAIRPAPPDIAGLSTPSTAPAVSSAAYLSGARWWAWRIATN